MNFLRLLSMVRLKNLSKSFGAKSVIRDVSLEIPAGERFILLGKSGCGKTTLLRLLAGFERPDRGAILIAGEDVAALPVERRPVGFIFQNYALFPHMTVYDNIAIGPRIRKTPEPDIARRIDELLEITHLTGLRAAHPGRLSGGESQRVAIARALVNRPKVLLLDEPLSALDASLRQGLRAELKEMQEALGITFLFVTHDQEEAMSLATRIGVLENGQLLQVGTPTQLYDHPESPFVAGFLGAINRFSGTVERHDQNRTLVVLDAEVKIACASGNKYPAGQKVTCCIRPEKMVFRADDDKGSGKNRIPAVIVEKTFLGNQTVYTAKLANGQTCTVPVGHGPGESEKNSCQLGERVTIQFSACDVLLFDKSDAPERTHDALAQ
ncbi:Putrescine transport ATP-binding protein PotA (TC 3.A.1.11.1) [hydrothermal vent metagenome]|uniref:Putrescine transport ATP-binding protein PotA (TC 3.A.1.11.1) n=1 Tax=hydrothermal vent metagenome TaxID=652676 RepID=A0A3B1DCY7_9ZZZZ